MNQSEWEAYARMTWGWKRWLSRMQYNFVRCGIFDGRLHDNTCMALMPGGPLARFYTK